MIVVVNGLKPLAPSIKGSGLILPNERFTPTSPCRTIVQLPNNNPIAAMKTKTLDFILYLDLVFISSTEDNTNVKHQH
jgi:hypothetical protein